MEPEARYTWIGAVLLALAVAAIMSFVWLSSGGRAADFRFYTVYFERQSLEGLQIGGDVNMRGVKVGRVEDYVISRANINRVSVQIRVARETPVSENTTAVVVRNILTGIARINLETPGTPGPELLVVPPGERYPVITEGTSNLDQIADAVSRLAVRADAALENLNRVLGPQNQRSFTEVLASVGELSGGLSERLATVDDTARSLRGAADAFGQASRGIERSVDRVTRSIEPLGHGAGDALREITLSSQRLEGELAATLRRLERDAGGLARRADDAVDIGVHELRATAETLRSSVELITRALDRLQDPKALLLGPGSRQMGPGEEDRR